MVMHGQTLSATELSLIVESITEYAIFSLDANGRVRMWNEGAQRVFGYAAEEIIGQSAEVLFTPEDRERGEHGQEMRNAARTGRAADEREHLRKDGSRFFASGVLFPLRDQAGSVTGFVKVCRDLTDRRATEQALLDAGEALEARVAERTEQLSAELVERRSAEKRTRGVLSRLITLQEEERRRIARDLHDHLGQQVTALHLQLETLRRELQEKGSDAVERLKTVHALFTQLARDLDFFTWELRPGALYNLGLVAALTDFTHAFASNYGLPITFECVGLVDGDVHRDLEINLYRIAQEALNNAYKHARASSVDVLLQKTDGRVVLTVSDDGVGFKREEQQARQSIDRGMGLDGLRERAELLGGTFEIESKPNEGTTVIVSVPVRRRDATG